MEIINPFREEHGNIKICRLCGSNNKENIDIFASKPISSRNDDLLTKILTVYPLVLYKNDPLPQHICPKCIGNVSTTYQDIQQVLRQQNKWMNITKAVQPEHKYFRILDAVEHSTKSTIERIKSSYNIEINNLPLRNLFTNLTTENKNNTVINTNNKLNITENVVKNIQTKLESNGFTIKRIKVSTSNEAQQNPNASTDPLHFSDDICVINDDDDDDDIVSCNYCQQKFSNMKVLAQHQLIHLNVNANKVFPKRLLPKQLRRGRLITLNDNKCIRCLNCWRIFKDNKSILQHWSGGECEFFCSVCGKEFPNSPKTLREHVAAAHDISFRSLSREFMTNQTLQSNTTTAFIESTNQPTNNLHTGLVKKSGYKKPPPKSCTKNEDGTITCKICHKVFDNFRSSNSHMRKHKPPSKRFGEGVFPQSTFMDKYNTQDDYMPQPTTSHFPYGPHSINMKPPRSPYHVFMKNGPLHGIKTKIGQKRHDYLTNYTNNEPYPMQRSMMSSGDNNEGDDDYENVIVPELLMPNIKAEPILDDNTHNDGDNGSTYVSDTSSSYSNVIKSEPLDNSEHTEMTGPHLCFICNESFSNIRDYELHAMFVHNIN
ncbi:uncharacterized protein ACRADG_000852 [Cochliomyia hominivorax]